MKWHTRFILMIGVLLLALIVPSAMAVTQNEGSGNTDVETANLALVDQYIDFNQHLADYTVDGKTFFAKYTSFFKSSYIQHDPFSNKDLRMTWGEMFTNWYKPLSAAFPDLEFTVESVLAKGDRVYLHYSSTGMFTNSYEWTASGMGDYWKLSIDPTSKKVTETGVVILRVENGKFVEQWWYINNPMYWAREAIWLDHGFAGDPMEQEIYGNGTLVHPE